MRCGWIAAAVVAACFMALGEAQPARAATVTWRLRCDKSGGFCAARLAFAAEPGESNRVTLEPQGDTLTIRDAAGLDAGSGCSQVDELAVRCPLGHYELGLGALFHLGDEDDRLDARRLPGPSSIEGGPGDDTLFGPVASSAKFLSSPGNDRMVGGQANDLFYTSHHPDGSDTLIGGAEPPPLGGTWYSEEGDWVRYARRTHVRIDLTGARDDGQRGERDAVVGMELVETGSGNDVIVGTAADERLFSGGGNDVLRAGGGADDLDTEDPQHIQLSRGVRLDDILDGGAGPDLIDAGTGADRLTGGPGRDQLDGGLGRDRIVSADAGTSPDWVLCGSGRDSASADRADFVMADCEHSRGGRRRGAGPLASVRTYDAVLVQVGCPAKTRCKGPISVELDGRKIVAGRFRASPHASAEVQLFPPPLGAGEGPIDLADAVVRVGGKSVPLAALPRYRITQSLIGIR